MYDSSSKDVPLYQEARRLILQVRGTVETAAGERLERPMLFGKWDEAMWAELPNGKTEQLWRVNPPPPDPTRYGHSGLCPDPHYFGKRSAC